MQLFVVKTFLYKKKFVILFFQRPAGARQCSTPVRRGTRYKLDTGFSWKWLYHKLNKAVGYPQIIFSNPSFNFFI